MMTGTTRNTAMRMMTSFVLLACWAAPVGAQTHPAAVADRLVADPDVAATLERLVDGETWVIDRQIELCEIPAPPFQEEARAAAYRDAFAELGLQDVRTDAVGNVIGVRPGRAARPNVVITAHLDTVFPPETDVSVSRDGSVLRGPGIADDCRGLAVLLGVIRALQDSGVTTEGTLTFAGTVGEEGLGDLRGVKHLFADELAGRIDTFISSERR